MPQQYTRIPIADRFWPKVNKDGPVPAHRPELGPCWLWTAGRTQEGYGHFRISRDGRWIKTTAHRVAFELTYGPLDEGLFACHHCDTPPCVRPDHLFVGPPGDNSRDAARKGRLATGERHGSQTHPERVARGDRNGARTHPERLPYGDRAGARKYPERYRGERNAMARLTEDEVRQIRLIAASGQMTQAQMAKHFGVGQATICRAATGRSWSHVS